MVVLSGRQINPFRSTYEFMSVARPRNRLVYFRVSEDEFQRLSGMCHGAEGARSISELARSAVNRMLSEQNGDRMLSVDQRLELVEAHLRTLTELLAANRSPEQAESGCAPQSGSADVPAPDSQNRE
jgi:hypothetical protein